MMTDFLVNLVTLNQSHSRTVPLGVQLSLPTFMHKRRDNYTMIL